MGVGNSLRVGRLITAVLVVLFAVPVAAAQSYASDRHRPDYFDIMTDQTSPAVGRAYYEKYCATCHGDAGDGTGPMATLFKVPPADLRTLGQRFGMPLPVGRLARLIDGRDIPRAHGNREMPVWGEAFDTLPWMGGSGRDNAIRNRLARIIYFLDTIQVPPAAKAQDEKARR